ncbi:large ribosomal subunit protein mL46 [Denticeps clupeoides]|uniref:Large ribosomal subunit protein mL46 n=1 Tax=Denticeps clupeoides TaxID=299321 RepID=A0AAY4BAL2_9TELE|nr:39S ribosomal protein L46, mitochondrial [Denticeps clupeoides]
MAAPVIRMSGRAASRFLISPICSTVRQSSFRSFSATGRWCGAVKLKSEAVVSPWRLYGAVCLQRLPVISQDPNCIEKKFAHVMHQMELERSLLSDHELRLLEDAERMSRRQEEDYDSDEEDVHTSQEIVTAQDLEDTWEQNLKQFQPAVRSEGAADKDPSSSDRCLGDSLVLLVEQSVGGEKLWLLPQLQWEAGETLRQTAERALASLPGTDVNATFLGNAPCGVYKYKFPKDIRTERSQGAKVFFFKAVLSSRSSSTSNKGSFVWAKKSELEEYLKPAYFKQVSRFILNL